MRILFIGAVDFSAHCLSAMLDAGANVVGIVNPDAAHARINTDHFDLAPLAEKHGIPLHRVEKINAPESRDFIVKSRPDVIFVFGFSQLLGPEILALPPKGVIGVHPTLLPEGRGRHPLIWALVKGLDRSGLSFFYMDAGADSGDILWQRPFEIAPEDDAGTLYRKIKVLATEAIGEFLPRLAAGNAPRLPQNEAQASYWPKRTKQDGQIDWCRSAAEVCNLVRALAAPYPGAHTYLGGAEVTVWRARPLAPAPEPDALAPGTVVAATAGELTVRCGEACVGILDWTCARDIVANDRFEVARR